MDMIEVVSWGFVRMSDVDVPLLVREDNDTGKARFFVDKNDIWILSEKFDVMIIKTTIGTILALDTQGGRFRQR